MVDSFNLIVFSYILNHYRSHRVLSDALNIAISMSLKFNIEINFATFDNLMEENANVVFELSCLAFNIKKEFATVLDFFLSFLRKFEKTKSHNMFILCLNLLVVSKVRSLSKNMT